jgi:hypothetical protein
VTERATEPATLIWHEHLGFDTDSGVEAEAHGIPQGDRAGVVEQRVSLGWRGQLQYSFGFKHEGGHGSAGPDAG